VILESGFAALGRGKGNSPVSNRLVQVQDDTGPFPWRRPKDFVLAPFIEKNDK